MSLSRWIYESCLVALAEPFRRYRNPLSPDLSVFEAVHRISDGTKLCAAWCHPTRLLLPLLKLLLILTQSPDLIHHLINILTDCIRYKPR